MMFQVWNFVAMFFADADTKHIFSVILAMSAGLGSWFAVMEGIRYGKIDFLRLGKVFTFSLMFYGMFLSNTDDLDLTLFDDVTFQNATISGIPDGLLFLACSANNLTVELERKVWGLASSPVGTWTYGAASEGAGMRLLRESYDGKMAGIFNQVLSATVFNSTSEYIENCFAVEAAADANVLSSFSTSAPITALANGANPALTTSTYINNAGVLMAAPALVPCDQAYDNLLAYFTNGAALGGDFSTVVDTFCTLMSADQAGLRAAAGTGNSCQEVLTQSLNAWAVGGGGANANIFAEQIFVARQWEKYKQSLDSAEAVARSVNFNRVAAELGHKTFVAAEWIPVLKNVLLMVIIGLLPFLAMFCVTASGVEAVKFSLGLFVWWGLWCVIDVMFLAFWLSHAERTFDIMATAPAYAAQGLADLWPLASKSLDLLGELRMFGLTLSAAVTFGVLKFGGYAIASMGQNLTRSLMLTGSDATAGGAYMAGNPQGASASIRSSLQNGNDQAKLAGGSDFLMRSGLASGFGEVMSLSQQRGAMMMTAGSGGTLMDALARHKDLGDRTGMNTRAALHGEHTHSGPRAHFNAGAMAAGKKNAIQGVMHASGYDNPEHMGSDAAAMNMAKPVGELSELRQVLASPNQLGPAVHALSGEKVAAIGARLGGVHTAIRSLGMANMAGVKLVGFGNGSWIMTDPAPDVSDANISSIHYSELGIRSGPLMNKFAGQVLSGDTEGARKTGAEIYQLARTAGNDGLQFLANTKWQGMRHNIQTQEQAATVNAATGGNFRVGDQVTFGMTPDLLGGAGQLHNVMGGDRSVVDHSASAKEGRSFESLNSTKAQGLQNYAYFAGNVDGRYGYYRLRGSIDGDGTTIKGNGYIATLNENGRWEENSLPAQIIARASNGKGADLTNPANLRRNDHNPNYIPIQNADTIYSFGSQTLSAGAGVTGKNGSIEALGNIVQGLGRSSGAGEQASSAAAIYFGSTQHAERNLYQALDEQNSGYGKNFNEQVQAASNLGNQSQLDLAWQTNGTILGKIAELAGGASAGVKNSTAFRESMQKATSQSGQGDIFKAAMYAIAHSSDDVATKAMKAQQVLDLRNEFQENLAGKTDSQGDIGAGQLFHDAQAEIFQDSAAVLTEVPGAKLDPQEHTLPNNPTLFDFGGKKFP